MNLKFAMFGFLLLTLLPPTISGKVIKIFTKNTNSNFNKIKVSLFSSEDFFSFFASAGSLEKLHGSIQDSPSNGSSSMPPRRHPQQPPLRQQRQQPPLPQQRQPLHSPV